MSIYFQELCNAIRMNDKEKLKEIGDLINKNIFTNDVKEFYVFYQRDYLNLLFLVATSKFDQTFRVKFLNWLNVLATCQGELQTFEQNYLPHLANSVSKLSIYPFESNAVCHELIALNNHTLNNSIQIYLAFTQGYKHAMDLPSEVQQVFFSSLITLAYNCLSANLVVNENNISKFFTTLIHLSKNGFTINNITEILTVHPVWTLSYINQFYDIFKNSVPQQEMQNLILQMPSVDWQYVTIPSVSAERKKLILEHARNPVLPLGAKAFNVGALKNEAGFNLAYTNPFMNLLNEPLIPEKNNILVNEDASNNISNLEHSNLRSNQPLTPVNNNISTNNISNLVRPESGMSPISHIYSGFSSGLKFYTPATKKDSDEDSQGNNNNLHKK